MKIKIDTKLTYLNKEVLKDKNGELDLKSVMVEALMANYDDEKDLTGDQKLVRYNLASRINASTGEIDLSIEEIALIKKLIGKAYGVLVTGQVFNILEGK